MARAYYPSGDGSYKPWTADMVGAAAENHIHYAGVNIITSAGEDSVQHWGQNYSNTLSFFTPDSKDKIQNQPSDWGYIVNFANGETEVHQLWLTQSSGDIYHRGGNGSGWAGNGWTRMVDSHNPEVVVSTSQPTNSNAKIWVKI